MLAALTGQMLNYSVIAALGIIANENDAGFAKSGDVKRQSLD
jgi:hypothetical protein